MTKPEERHGVLGYLAGLLRVPEGEVEAVLRHDAARARETVSRRQFMGAAAALTSAPFVPKSWIEVALPAPVLGYQLTLKYDQHLWTIAAAIGGMMTLGAHGRWETTA